MKSTAKKRRGGSAPKLSDRTSLALVRKLTGDDSPLDPEARGWLDGVTAELIEETGALGAGDTLRRAYADATRIADGWKPKTKADSRHSFVPLAAVVSRVRAGEDAQAVVRELMDAERQRQKAAAKPQAAAEPNLAPAAEHYPPIKLSDIAPLVDRLVGDDEDDQAAALTRLLHGLTYSHYAALHKTDAGALPLESITIEATARAFSKTAAFSQAAAEFGQAAAGRKEGAE